MRANPRLRPMYPWNPSAPLKWLIQAIGIGCFAAASLAQSVDPSVCRELEAKYDTTKPQLTSVEVNQMLFRASDLGCERLARRLLDDGASLQARDRLGAAPL